MPATVCVCVCVCVALSMLSSWSVPKTPGQLAQISSHRHCHCHCLRKSCTDCSSYSNPFKILSRAKTQSHFGWANWSQKVRQCRRCKFHDMERQEVGEQEWKQWTRVKQAKHVIMTISLPAVSRCPPCLPACFPALGDNTHATDGDVQVQVLIRMP